MADKVILQVRPSSPKKSKAEEQAKRDKIEANQQKESIERSARLMGRGPNPLWVTPFLCKMRFRNELPPPPIEMRFLAPFVDPQAMSRYEVSSVEATAHPQKLHLKVNHVHSVDLMNPDLLDYPADGENWQSEDRALLVGKGQNEFEHTFMRRTEIATSSFETIGKTSSAQRATADSGPPPVRRLSLAERVALARKSFADAKLPPCHPTNRDMVAKRELSLVPLSAQGAGERDHTIITYTTAKRSASARSTSDASIIYPMYPLLCPDNVRAVVSLTQRKRQKLSIDDDVSTVPFNGHPAAADDNEREIVLFEWGAEYEHVPRNADERLYVFAETTDDRVQYAPAAPLNIKRRASQLAVGKRPVRVTVTISKAADERVGEEAGEAAPSQQTDAKSEANSEGASASAQPEGDADEEATKELEELF